MVNRVDVIIKFFFQKILLNVIMWIAFIILCFFSVFTHSLFTHTITSAFFLASLITSCLLISIPNVLCQSISAIILLLVSSSHHLIPNTLYKEGHPYFLTKQFVSSMPTYYVPQTLYFYSLQYQSGLERVRSYFCCKYRIQLLYNFLFLLFSNIIDP